MLYANKTVGNTSYKLSKKSMKEQTLLQKNKDLLIEIATRDVKSVFAYFKTTRDGLSMKEAQKRIQVYGRNELTSKRARIAEVMMKLSGMIPGFFFYFVRDGLQCEKITVSRVECFRVKGVNGELFLEI